jgi:hypothetical protein
MHEKGTRRLDADDPRYADLPLVAFDAADGQVRVLRGQVGFTPEFARQRRWLETRPGVPHVVFVSRRGDVTLLPVGGRVAASDAADPRSVSRWSVPTLDGCADLSEVAARLRAAAAEVEALAADGWLAERVGDSDVELRDAVFDA